MAPTTAMVRVSASATTSTAGSTRSHRTGSGCVQNGSRSGRSRRTAPAYRTRRSATWTCPRCRAARPGLVGHRPGVGCSWPVTKVPGDRRLDGAVVADDARRRSDGSAARAWLSPWASASRPARIHRSVSILPLIDGTIPRLMSVVCSWIGCSQSPAPTPAASTDLKWPTAGRQSADVGDLYRVASNRDFKILADLPSLRRAHGSQARPARPSRGPGDVGLLTLARVRRRHQHRS